MKVGSLLVGAAIIFGTIVAILFFWTRQSSSEGIPNISNDNAGILPSPSPFLFEELTIPYLRNRDYAGDLGQMIQVSNNSNYTSYLTSYDSDGLKINGLLTIPEGQEPDGGWPAVVFVHGYIPPRQYLTIQNYASYVDYLARNGLVVFKIDLRGHADSEGDANGAYYSSDYVVDALNARAALQSSEFVNPQSIGLWGHSMAGNVVFRSLAAKPDIPAIVIWAGAVYSYSDLQKYGIDDGSYQQPPNDSERQKKRELLRETYGDFSEDSSFWKQVAGTNFISDIGGAIQINHAVDDNVVDIGYSRDLMKLLDNTNVIHELKEQPSGGHNISGSSFNSAMQNTVEFFKENLD